MLEGNLYRIVEKAEGCATVQLLPDSSIYAAHFPGYPITPGVTILQMALELMGCGLSGAKDIKFVAPLLPGPEGIRVCFSWSFPNDGTAEVNVSLPDGTLCAKMSLSV